MDHGLSWQFLCLLIVGRLFPACSQGSASSLEEAANPVTQLESLKPTPSLVLILSSISPMLSTLSHSPSIRQRSFICHYTELNILIRCKLGLVLAMEEVLFLVESPGSDLHHEPGMCDWNRACRFLSMGQSPQCC